MSFPTLKVSNKYSADKLLLTFGERLHFQIVPGLHSLPLI